MSKNETLSTAERQMERVIEQFDNISTFKIKLRETSKIFNYYKVMGDVPKGNVWHRRLLKVWKAIK